MGQGALEIVTIMDGALVPSLVKYPMIFYPEQPCGVSIAVPILQFTTLSLGDVGKEGPKSAVGIK